MSELTHISARLALNATDPEIIYSPLMLSSAYPRVQRFMFVLLCCFIGSVLNGFFIASVVMADIRRTVGYIHLLIVGMADFMVTFLVMGTSSVILLSNKWDTPNVCKVLQIIVETALYITNVSFMLFATELFIWISGSRACMKVITTRRTKILNVASVIVSYILACVGVLYDLDYDYCNRKHFGNITFRIWTATLFYLIPGTTTFSKLLVGVYQLKYITHTDIRFRRTASYPNMCSYTVLALIAYLTFALSWLPYLIYITLEEPSDSHYYYAIWFALLRPVFQSAIYYIGDNYFRNNFIVLFNYFFRKRPLTVPRNRRRSRGQGRSVQAIELRRLAAGRGLTPLTRPILEITETRSL
ncbi:uncharacterized protein LOC112049119 [Bicyclus anynana]|uniref:Uncharacterized protein LOC112049119 n=1 Tax=Bicyclus anynana TaxID=110368 RepID=A0A6J1NHS5_BICAN|nr:uncharacterized protein LOC112049119 [Bicyclus anynana]